jgi:hypothetical protein
MAGKLILALLLLAIAICEDLEIRDEEKVPNPPPPKKIPRVSNDYNKQLDKLFLYQCLQLVNVKISMEFNNSLESKITQFKGKDELLKKYMHKLMLYNIEKCMNTMKSAEFIELLKTKNNNKSNEYILQKIEVPLEDEQNLEPTNSELSIIEQLNQLKKDIDDYNNSRNNNHTNTTSPKANSINSWNGIKLLVTFCIITLIVIFVLIKYVCCSSNHTSKETKKSNSPLKNKEHDHDHKIENKPVLANESSNPQKEKIE